MKLTVIYNSKRDDEENPTTVNTIRKNMKDMTTADNNLTESRNSDDEVMGTIPEEEDKPVSSFAKFGGGGKDDEDDWGEFAEEEEEAESKPAKVEETDKSKYTFGSTSGFGTKGWAASHQTIPTPSKVKFFF